MILYGNKWITKNLQPLQPLKKVVPNCYTKNNKYYSLFVVFLIVLYGMGLCLSTALIIDTVEEEIVDEDVETEGGMKMKLFYQILY